MARKDINQKQLAYLMAISEAELTRKFSGERHWNNAEITILLNVLNLVLLPERKLTKALLSAFEEGDE
jgi:hypothetical protein